MLFRCFFLFAFLFCNAPVFGEKTESNLLEAAIEETESDGKSFDEPSVIPKKRTKAPFWRRLTAKKTKKRKRKLSSSSRPKDFDLGDVVIKVSGREMEDVPAVYPNTINRRQSAAVLEVRQKPARRTSSLPGDNGTASGIPSTSNGGQ